MKLSDIDYKIVVIGHDLKSKLFNKGYEKTKGRFKSTDTKAKIRQFLY